MESCGVEKNALYTTGIKYAALSKELIRSTTRTDIWWASKDPNTRYHLLKNPPVGGRPMILKEAMKNAVMVKGILFPIPTISLMFLLPVATKIAPAQKNRVIFPKACMAI